jgi:positive regulator of sigma E activity
MNTNIQFIRGFSLALIAPLLSWLVLKPLFTHIFWLTDKPATPFLLATAANLILLRYFARHDKDTAVKAVALVTFLFAVVTFYLKFKL